jgi:hypothetical protein
MAGDSPLPKRVASTTYLVSRCRTSLPSALSGGLAAMTVATLFVGSAAWAQDPKMKPTASDGGPGIGAYAIVGVGLGSLAEVPLPRVQAGVNVLFQSRWGLGVTFRRSLGEPSPEAEVDGLYYDTVMWGGQAEYMMPLGNRFLVGAALAGGWGEVDADFVVDTELDTPFGEENFAWAEATLNAQAVLHRFVRLRLDAGWTQAFGVDYRVLDSADLSGPTVTLSLLGGYF